MTGNMERYMKSNSLISFIILLALFAVSCGSEIKFGNPNDKNSDAYQGDADSETPDNGDTADDADSTDPSDPADPADSGDDGDTADPDVTDTGTAAGETRVGNCEGLPENASWNTVSAIVQTWNGEKWVPSLTAVFDTEGSEDECRFRCNENYGWDGSECILLIHDCPNNCSGVGSCDTSTGICSCYQGHEGPDCSECPEGYHLEAANDDEDGSGTLSCAPDKSCLDYPQPCNNQGCAASGDTVECTCSSASHRTGRWCEKCTEGYLESFVDGSCKPDCTLTTCIAPKKCGIDYETNEAGCNQCTSEYYYGETCTSCDTDYFCNGHATACVVSSGTERCTCETGYTGGSCGDCADDYFESNGECLKKCDENKCFKTHTCTGVSILGFETSSNVSGHGTCNSTTGGCDCDPGWIDGTSDLGAGTTVQCGTLTVLETLNNVLCMACDLNNPPDVHSEKGCPLNLVGNGSTSACSFCGSGGTCYYEPTGDHRLYCECKEHYTMAGDRYSGYCEADTQTAACTGLPANAQWNTVSSITQTWTGSSWSPTTTAAHSDTGSTEKCLYKCKSGYTFDGSSMCVKTGDTRSASCSSKPSNTVWNTSSTITQTWSGTAWTPSTTSTYSETAVSNECHYKCASGYTWNGSSCQASTGSN